MAFITTLITNNVAVITLDRAEKFNSFNREMALQLQDALDECDRNEGIRCVMITGSGKAFSAGQDIAELIGDEPMPIEKILSEHYNPIVTRIRKLSKPVIAAVNGVAAGAGANIALCCDIVLAATSSSFIQAFSKIGLIPDSGGTYFLPRLMGFQKASALMMTGDKVSAADAERLGMVYKIFDDENFQDSCLAVAEQLAKMPTVGLYFTKMALNDSMKRTLEEQLEEEDILQQKAAQTSDYAEGINAFLEKRTAIFTGK